jgi:hypothetical protein
MFVTKKRAALLGEVWLQAKKSSTFNNIDTLTVGHFDGSTS